MADFCAIYEYYNDSLKIDLANAIYIVDEVDFDVYYQTYIKFCQYVALNYNSSDDSDPECNIKTRSKKSYRMISLSPSSSEDVKS